MEKVHEIPYYRISFFFILIVALITWGFFKTYIIFFPSFEGFIFAQHFHGAMMMTWLGFLVIQPMLIRFGKIRIHRWIGKLTYVIAPLLVASIVMVTKMVYAKMVPPVPDEERIGVIALSIPGAIAFAIFYLCAIANRRNTPFHLRYMIATSLLMVGPGLGRALIVYYNMQLDPAVDITNYLVIGIAAVCLVSDIVRKRSWVPYSIILAVLVWTHIVWEMRYTAMWQSIGKGIAAVFF